MTFSELIYAPLIAEFDDILANMDRLAERQADETLDALAFDLSGHIAALELSRGGEDRRTLHNLAYFLSRNEVQTVMLEVGEGQYDRLVALVKIGEVLEEDQLLDFTTTPNLNPADLKIAEDISPLPFSAFGYENPNTPIDSIGFINFGDVNWSSQLGNSGLTHSLLAAFYAHVCSAPAFNNGAYLLVRADAAATSAKSALRLQAVAHGLTIHIPTNARLVPSLSSVATISPIQPIQQFDELILIFSEYNSRNEVLSKFLSIYHVIESFMFKVPLVSLSIASDGKMFSLRDFKRIYKQVDINEGEALKSLIALLWDTRVQGRPFSAMVADSVRCLQRNRNLVANDANEFLSKLCVFSTNGLTQLTGVNPKIYSNLLYSVRNAIVHNGETEHHISHHNLNATVRALIEELLMAPLEALLFTVIGDHTSKVWYRGAALELYAT